MVGTALSTVVAMVIAVPLALVIALLLVELVHPTVGKVVGTAIEMLAAIPSIIFGMVGIFVVVPFMQDTLVPWLAATLGSVPGIKPGATFNGGGLSILTAGVVLAFMVLPYITSVSRDVMRMVPQVTKEAGYGMGSTTWEVMRKISVPYASSGIVGAVFIGLGRALGETMAVAFIIGSVYSSLPHSLLDPGTTIASLIANTFNEATDTIQIAALIELGLILLLITMVFQVIAQAWLSRAQRAEMREQRAGQKERFPERPHDLLFAIARRPGERRSIWASRRSRGSAPRSASPSWRSSCTKSSCAASRRSAGPSSPSPRPKTSPRPRRASPTRWSARS